MQDRVLHEGEANLAERALHRIVVKDVLRERELAVEVEGRDLVIGGASMLW